MNNAATFIQLLAALENKIPVILCRGGVYYECIMNECAREYTKRYPYTTATILPLSVLVEEHPEAEHFVCIRCGVNILEHE